MKNKTEISVVDKKTNEDITEKTKLSAIFYTLDNEVEPNCVLISRVINLIES